MAEGEIKYEEVRDLKPGRFVLIDGEPCKISNMTHSKPGKHGEAKYMIEGIGIFDDKKRTTVVPATHKIEVPVINKNKAQVLNIIGKKLQLMDMTNYETFEIDIPENVNVTQGQEITYISFGNRKRII